MSGTDNGRSSAHLAHGIRHLVVPLAAVISFYLVEKPQQEDVARRTADLRKSMVSDKARFIEERLKVGSVPETDVLKLMGSPDRTSEEAAQIAGGKESERHRLLTWRIGEQEVWGVFVKHSLVIATLGPGPASLPVTAPSPPSLAGAAERHKRSIATDRRHTSVAPP